MRHVLAAGLTAALHLLPGTAAAQDVTLSSPGGGVEISGRFLSYDGEFYRIDSAYGVLTVDANGVDCAGAPCPGPGPFVAELMFSGAAGASAGLVPALLEAFATESGYAFTRQEEDETHFLYVLTKPETDEAVAQVRFRVTSTEEGFADLLAETANVALAFREPTGDERMRAREAGLGALSASTYGGALALDAITPLVAPENPVRSIRYGDLADVLAGRITTWAALGGPDTPISVHMPAAGSAMDAIVAKQLLAPDGLAMGAVDRHGDLANLEKAVLADPLALGVSLRSAASEARMLALEGPCGAEAIPDSMSIKAGDYPLLAPHLFFRPALRAPPVLEEFLAFARSPAAQGVVREAGFVDQGIETEALEEQGDRLAGAILGTGRDVGARDLRRLIGDLRGSEQMSLSFRFEDGTMELDAAGEGTLTRLAEAVRQGAFDGATLLLAGFSDTQGSGAANLEVSRRRAEAVRERLLDALGDDEVPPAIEAKGYGEAMPLACDEAEWGRRINRRVEVWVRR